MRYIMHTLWVATMVIPIGCHFGESDIDKLIEASKAKLPLVGSALIDKPFNVDDLPQARSYVETNPDYSSYHLLLALRKHHPKEYNRIPTVAKAKVLSSTIKNTRCLNDWGLLDRSDPKDLDESEKALLEVGKESIQYLVPLLSDAKEALIDGSEESSLSRRHKYRRKDFAYRYIMLIREEQPTFHADPKERDKDIEALKTKLKKDAK